MANANDEIRQFILSEFLHGEESSNLRDNTPLRTGGILDSMAVIRLVSFLEQRYGIAVEDHEANIQNFNRIDSIVAFVRKKGGVVT